MMMQELDAVSEQIAVLAKQVPDDGFDGDASKEIVRLLVAIAQTYHLDVRFVETFLVNIATYYRIFGGK